MEDKYRKKHREMPWKNPCTGCWHWRGDFYKTCNYIFDMGRKRPCEPGKECTERSDITEAGIFHPWREID
jgi:hypothetical protein